MTPSFGNHKKPELQNHCNMYYPTVRGYVKGKTEGALASQNLRIEQIEKQTILLIRDMVVESWNRQFGRQTIHPTQKFTSMNLLQMPCVIT